MLRTRIGTRLQPGGMTLLLLGFIGLNGCASDPPKPAPTMTPDHVRSHSDNAFQKLKQEERDARGDRAAPR
jgi:hypothetical protein